MNLQIQCPKCSKRFTVDEDLSGKTVECGSCDHRFPVKSGAIIEERSRVYPGEHGGDDFFNRLGRQPGGKAAKQRKRVAPSSPAPQVDAIMPASPSRNIAAAVGGSLLLLYTLMLFVGTTEGGFLQDVVMVKRVVLASFVSIVSLVLIIYGAKTWRFQATMIALVFVAAIAALTALRPVISIPVISDGFDSVPEEKFESEEEEELTDSKIKERVGYHAVERKHEALAEQFGPAAPEYVVAIFIEDLSASQFFKVEKYFQSVFKIPPREGVSRYKRNNERDSLIVISGIKIDFDEVVRQCDPRLGRATTYPELRLIDLRLSSIHASEIDDDLREKMSNPENLAFYATNLKELGALDPQRVKNSVRVLSTVPAGTKLQYQDEIILEFMRLLGSESDKELLADLGKALRVWAPGNQASLTVVSQHVEKWLQGKKKIYPDFLEYLIENKAPKALIFVDQLWSEEPEMWMNQYALMGPAAETRLLEHLETSSLRLKKPAAAILASIGTEQSLPVLAKFAKDSDDELKINVERAIKAIKAR